MKKNKQLINWSLLAVFIVVIGIGIALIFTKYSDSGNQAQNPAIGSNQEKPADEPEPTVSPEDTNPIQPEVILEKEELPLFTGDSDTYDKKQYETIEITPETTIEDKLKLIADHLSKTQFDGLPIEIQKIETIDGKKIAIINLQEKNASAEGAQAPKNWMNYLNAGSTGSAITLITLEESFLQKDLEGDWIDGIKIIHEGQAIEEMDHFPGTTIIYRAK
ncbi:MAG: putative lipoprotein [Clostridia bacterium]|jgi:uncharacterized protein YlzI (FlbEa/FlbD family)|nr:putative lipoprotein [Clostridia bacterium]